MKRKFILTLISSLLITNSVFAEQSGLEAIDFTGEAFFIPASPIADSPNTRATSNMFYDTEEPDDSHHGTTPPMKNLRLKLQERAKYRDAINSELAPTAKDIYESETADINLETSEYASSQIEENFDESIDLETEPEKEATKNKKSLFKRNKKGKAKNTEEIILDCENVDYDTNNYVIYATGDVNVKFVKQGTTVKADVITFDRINNTVKAEGNVKILKSGRTVVGDYIFLDLNEESGLIENPVTRSSNIEIKSKKGYVYSDKIVQEDGAITIKDDFPIDFRSRKRGPQMKKMLIPKNQTLTKDINDELIRIKVKDLKITQRGEHEILYTKKMGIYKGDRTLLKLPSVKLYTNKNHDYVEKAGWEIGTYRGLGMYVGPGFVFELPKGSVLRAMPILNYKSGIGFGALGRFSSGTNQTMAAYGTAVEKVIIHGKQELDDNLFLQYAMNGYMNEWFLGRRRPKYGASLVYDKEYQTNNFLLKEHPASFRHRLEGGYYHDLDFDSNFEKIKGTNMGTTRFRYMAQGRQNLFQYKNAKDLKSFRLDVISQMATSVYGNGDTQAIARFAPNIHIQYKRWMQDIGYYFSAYDDNTPFRSFDRYRYGKQAFQIREYLRLTRYLTICWFGNINMTNDSPNGRTFQENAFYLSIGPDDLKFNIGYDFRRQNLQCMFEVMMNAKGAKLEYDTFEIKQEKKAEKEKAPTKQKNSSFEYAPTQTKVLQRAVVENIKVMEDVL